MCVYVCVYMPLSHSANPHEFGVTYSHSLETTNLLRSNFWLLYLSTVINHESPSYHVNLAVYYELNVT